MATAISHLIGMALLPAAIFLGFCNIMCNVVTTTCRASEHSNSYRALLDPKRAFGHAHFRVIAEAKAHRFAGISPVHWPRKPANATVT
ncbi:hypothetical protein [Xanthomonas graminis]|nr:hypothetical protein [Xanthomonas translucens]